MKSLRISCQLFLYHTIPNTAKHRAIIRNPGHGARLPFSTPPASPKRRRKAAAAVMLAAPFIGLFDW